MSGVRLHGPISLSASALAPLTLIAAAWAIGSGGSPALRDTVTLALCNLTIVCGLQLFIGNSGIYSFGHIAFAAVGAYLGALLTLPAAFASLQTPAAPSVLTSAQLGSLPTTLTVAACCAVLAAVVGLPLMRTSTLAIPISTFAFLIVAYNVIANWDAVTGGSGGLVDIPATTGVGTAALWSAAAALAALAFKYSTRGYMLRASREEEVAAASLGIRLTRERLLAFALSAALCGVGGSLAAHQSGVLTPTSFYFAATVTTLTMLVVGGTRSVLGAVVGSLAIAAVVQLLNELQEGSELLGLIHIGETPGLAAIGLGLILLVTMIAMPEGISRGREAGELLRRKLKAPQSVKPPRRSKPHSSPRERSGQGLRADAISLGFSGLPVLRGVGLSLGPGEILGLIGPNGAGKTTLLNVLSGFQRPDAGTVLLDGQQITARRPSYLARVGIGRTFQTARPFSRLSALESVSIGAMAVGVNGRTAVLEGEQLLKRLGLFAFSNVEVGALPPGPQSLLGIARALASRPRYMLLDEPAAGLNDAECEELVDTLRSVHAEFGIAILLVEHDMNVVMDLCPRVQVLEQGSTLRIGTPAEVQVDPAVIECYLGASYLEVGGA